MTTPHRPTPLQCTLIRTDGGTQARAAINGKVVAEYANAMRAGATFPPVIVYHDGQAHWLADGFHRVKAAEQVRHEQIPAIVIQGTRRDAILHSVGANAAHGLRRTNADKRAAVMTLLNDAEWATWPQVKIAQTCGVSPEYVSRLKGRAKITIDRSIVQTSDGRTMNTANIGRTKVKQQAAPTDNEKPTTAGASGEADATGIFSRADEINEHMRQIRAVRDAILRAVNERNELYTFLKAGAFEADCNNILRALKHARPHAVCPYCAGEKCSACKDRGWINKLAYDQAPLELKSAAG